MSKPRGKKTQKPPMSRAPVTDDARFATVHSDPRFALPRKKDSKVTIDSRFRRMLEDDDFSHTAKVDRYGRKIASGAGKEEIKKYYKLEDSESETDSEEEEKRLKKKKGGDDDDEEDEEGEDEEEEIVAKPRYDPARGEGIVDTSDESSDEEEITVGEDAAAEEEEWRTADEVPTGDVYRRIAVVNLDWDNVRAQDLMAALSSFAPADGKVLSVKVYPSEFGKERMEREETEGPPKEIFTAKDEDDASDEEITATTIIKPDSGEEFDSTKLRKYQLERLRYYYAIVECDKKSTAKHIYDECDGAEYESSANFFDLRFVPDDTEFDDEPRDECSSVPVNYKPNEFVTDALQHSKVKLTWDQEDQTRKNKTKKAFSQKEIEEMDLRDYLASSDSEEEDAEALKNRYRSLLNLGVKIGGKEEIDGGVEITFTPSLTEAPKEAAKDEDQETTIERYARKEREKLKARKEAYQQKLKAKEAGEKSGSEAEEGSDAEAGKDLGFDDPFFQDEAPVDKKKEKKKQDKEAKKKEAIEKAAKRAELELLMVDDEDEKVAAAGKLKHFDMKEVIKAEKEKKLKGKRKRGKKAVEGEGIQEGFQVDVKDPRFAALYEEHEFAIDPTNPRYKETAAMKELMKEKRNRSKKNENEERGDEEARRKKLKAAPKEGDDVKRLVQSLKRKSGK